MWSRVRAPRWVLLWSDVLGSTVSRHVTLSDGCCLSSTISPAPRQPHGQGLLHIIAAGRTAGMKGPDDPAAALVTCRQLCPVSAVLAAWVCRDALPIRWPRLSHGAAAHVCFLSCLPCVTQECSEARLAQPVERKALNLVVAGSSPTVGVAMERCSWQHREQTCHFV